MELLQNLKEHGAKLCVATSKPEPMAKIVLDHLKVTPFLDYMAGADLDERHSNKTELIEKGLLHCNTKPNHAVMTVSYTHLLLAPHIMRRFIGNDYRFLLPTSALTGAVLLLTADTFEMCIRDRCRTVSQISLPATPF